MICDKAKQKGPICKSFRSCIFLSLGPQSRKSNENRLSVIDDDVLFENCREGGSSPLSLKSIKVPFDVHAVICTYTERGEKDH